MTQPLDASFDGFSHSIAGYVTDYVIFVVSFALGFVALNKRRKAFSAYSKNIMLALAVFLAFAGVAFLFGGVAHMYIRLFADSGDSLGKTWTAMHSGWLYPWLVAVASAPAGALANLNVLLSAVGRQGWLGPLLFLGSVLGALEIVLLTDETWLSHSGMPAALIYVAVSLTAVIWAVAMSARGRAGMMLFSIANGVILAGWLVVIGAPSGCGEYSNPNASCPFPAEFNQNAVFHSLLIVGLILEYVAVASFEDLGGDAERAVDDVIKGNEEAK